MPVFQYVNRKIYFPVYIFFSNPCLLRKKEIFLWRGGGRQANRLKAEGRTTWLNSNNSKIFLKGTCHSTPGLSGKPPYRHTGRRRIHRKTLQVLAAFVTRSRKYQALVQMDK